MDIDDADAASASRVDIDQATDILMARRRCTADDAQSLLTRAATQNDMTTDELAGCIVADDRLGA